MCVLSGPALGWGKPKLSKKTLEVLAAYPDHLAAAQKIEAEDPDRLKAEFVGKEQCFWEMDKTLKNRDLSEVIKWFGTGTYCEEWAQNVALEAARKRWDPTPCTVPPLTFDESTYADPFLVKEAWDKYKGGYYKELSASYAACAEAANKYNKSPKPDFGKSWCYSSSSYRYSENIKGGEGSHKNQRKSMGGRFGCVVLGATDPFFPALASYRERDKAIYDDRQQAWRARRNLLNEWREKLSPFTKECRSPYLDEGWDEAKARERLGDPESPFIDGEDVEKTLAGCTSFITALEVDDVPAYVKESMAAGLVKAKLMVAVVTKDKASLIKKAKAYRAKVDAAEASCKRIRSLEKELVAWKKCLVRAQQKTPTAVGSELDLFNRYFQPKIVSCAKSSGAYRKIAKDVENMYKWDVNCEMVEDMYRDTGEMGPQFDDGWNDEIHLIDFIYAIEHARYDDE